MGGEEEECEVGGQGVRRGAGGGGLRGVGQQEAGELDLWR